MHQADSNTTTRRTLLKGLGAYPLVAGALAAGTATTGAVTAGLAKHVLIDSDPIFAAIETHKRAMAATDAAFARYDEVAREAEKAGLRCEIVVPDYRNGASGDTFEKADCVSDIFELIPDDEKLRRHYVTQLGRRGNKWTAFVTDKLGTNPDDFVGEINDREWEAVKYLAELVPTTLAALVAKVDYFGQLANMEAEGGKEHARGLFDDCDTLSALVLSLLGSSSLLPTVA